MTKKKVVLEAIVFCLVFLILFFSAFLTFYLVSRQSMEERIRSISQVAEKIFDGDDLKTGEAVADYFSDSSEYRVSIIQKEQGGYVILYDSDDMLQSEGLATELETGNIGKFVTRKSSYGYDMVYYAVRDDENPDYFIRVAISESSATRISRNFLVYGSIVMAILMGSYIVFKYREYNRTVKPLKDQVERLLFLAGQPVNKLGGGEDLALIADSIDEVSSELDRKITDLQNERAKTKMILDSMSQGFLAVSGNGQIVLFNKKASEMFDYSEKDALFKDYHILSAGEAFSSRVENCLLGREEDIPFDIQLKGRTYQCNLMAMAYPWFDQTRRGVVILFLDVTEERSLVKIKTDFFANASHELKTPLTSILGYQEMLENGIFTTDAEKAEAIHMTIKEAKKMREMLSDMLSLSRLENGKERKLEDVELSSLIRSLVADMQPKLRENRISVDLKLEEYHLMTDRGDIEKVFSNLIDNAIKYNKKNGMIAIETNARERYITVSDTGIGIKEEHLSRIFERFYRVDNSKTLKNVEGTGLGLAIIKHICQRHGYHIEVRSVYGQGTTFILRT